MNVLTITTRDSATSKLRRRLAAALSSQLFWLPAAETLNRLARFAIAALLARQIGASAYGGWVLASVAAMLLASGGDLGLSTVVTARLAGDRASASHYLRNTIVVAPALVMMWSAVLLCAALVVGGRAGAIVALLGIGGLLEATAFLLLAPLRAQGNLRPESIIRAFQGCALLALGLPVLLLAHAGVIALALLFPAAGAAALVMAALATWRAFGLPRPSLDRRLVRGLLVESAPMLAAAVAALVYFRADAFLVATLRGGAETGIYGAAYNLAFGVSFIPLMLGRVLLPRFAAATELHERRRTYARAFRTMALSGAALTLLMLAATPFVPLVYGDQFAAARAPFAMLAIAQGLYFLTQLNTTLLLATRRFARVWLLLMLALAVNLVANAALIPAFGASGAALAAIISEASLAALQLTAVLPLLRLRRHAAHSELLAEAA